MCVGKEGAGGRGQGEGGRSRSLIETKEDVVEGAKCERKECVFDRKTSAMRASYADKGSLRK